MYIKVSLDGHIVDLIEYKTSDIYHVVDNIYADKYEYLYFYANGNSVNKYYSDGKIYRVGDLEVGHYYQDGKLSRIGNHAISYYYTTGKISHLGPHKIEYKYNSSNIFSIGSVSFHRDYYGKLTYIGEQKVY